MAHRLLLIVMMSAFALPAAALELEGQFKQGALLKGQVEPGTDVYLNDDPVPVFEDGRFSLGFGRDAADEHQVRLEKPSGETQTHEITIASRDYDIQRVEGVPQETVTPSEEHLDRIREEAARVREARAVRTSHEAFLGDYIWPVEGRITGVYGSQRYYNGEPRQPHYGVDVARPEGTDVMAPAAGEVTLAEPDLYFSGGTLIIDHGHGVSSTLLHLSAIHTEVGDWVEQGEVVAEVGMSGRATGPHLDWRMNWFSERIDPTTIAPPIESGYTPGADRD